MSDPNGPRLVRIPTSESFQLEHDSRVIAFIEYDGPESWLFVPKSSVYTQEEITFVNNFMENARYE